MLLGGAQAAALAARLNGWGMDARAVSEQLGVASAIKMCRSVMIKGLEALVIESYTATRAYQKAGFEPRMTAAIADRQQWVAEQARAGLFNGADQGVCWQDWAGALRRARPV